MAAFLLVEDNHMNMELAKFLIESAGHTCVVAEEGFTALELAKSQRFDIILLDIQLPKMNGYELLEHLRKLPNNKDVPVIAVSSYAMSGDAERGIAAGFNGYITKPIKPSNFLQQILSHARMA